MYKELSDIVKDFGWTNRTCIEHFNSWIEDENNYETLVKECKAQAEKLGVKFTLKLRGKDVLHKDSDSQDYRTALVNKPHVTISSNPEKGAETADNFVLFNTPSKFRQAIWGHFVNKTAEGKRKDVAGESATEAQPEKTPAALIHIDWTQNTYRESTRRKAKEAAEKGELEGLAKLKADNNLMKLELVKLRKQNEALSVGTELGLKDPDIFHPIKSVVDSDDPIEVLVKAVHKLCPLGDTPEDTKKELLLSGLTCHFDLPFGFINLFRKLDTNDDLKGYLENTLSKCGKEVIRPVNLKASNNTREAFHEPVTSSDIETCSS